MEKCTMGVFLSIATPSSNFILQLCQKMSPDTQHPARVSAGRARGALPNCRHPTRPKGFSSKALLLEHSTAWPYLASEIRVVPWYGWSCFPVSWVIPRYRIGELCPGSGFGDFFAVQQAKMSAEAYLESTAKKQQCSRMSSRSLSLYFKYFFLFELNTLLSHSPQKSQVNNWTANKQKMLGFPQRAQKSVLHHSPRQGTVVSCKCAFFFFLSFFLPCG